MDLKVDPPEQVPNTAGVLEKVILMDEKLTANAAIFSKYKTEV